MKTVKLKQLPRHSIDELQILSLCQSLYTVRMMVAGIEVQVLKGRDPYRALSIGQIYQDFCRCDIKKMTLIQDSAYDEMVGQPVCDHPNTLSIAAPIHVDMFDVRPQPGAH
ncbi:hypothetical protein SIN8267_00127 [Sinobacterium norvegicum]|uniref:Uncharacterized protein n=1 Tax=Sinobacterium norvegicum TaxID=1641715 RepID=A0ABM9AAZ3_9GAMM|nr:DUF6482 family protein [Sinobacterium norvegicum]CAH0990044.1 hypothetical protein SIN8267_00127 [Sinobacterium norvegicum]